MAKARQELQSSHQQEISKLEEERNILQRTLSTKRAKIAIIEKERDNLQGKVYGHKLALSLAILPISAVTAACLPFPNRKYSVASV